MRIRNSNPVFRGVDTTVTSMDGAVTYTNVAFKTIFLLLIAGGVGLYTYTKLSSLATLGNLIFAIVIGFISVLIGSRNVKLSPYFSVIYAISEGFVLSVVSYLYASLYEGIIPTAISTTVIVLLITMLMYSSGMVKVTSGFASFLVIGLISMIVMALLSLIFPFGGTFYYLIVGLSALLSVMFLFLDFENIKTCVDAGTDQSYSWILALGLMVTLVWIYVEILRLLAIFGRRR